MDKHNLITRNIAAGRIVNGQWIKETLSDLWDINAKKYPDQEALVSSQERITWREANDQITAVAIGLKECGFERDDALVVQLPNWIDSFILRVACDRAGIICVTAQMTLLEKDMEFILNQTKAKGLVLPYKWRGRDYYKKFLDIRQNLPHLKHIFISGGKAVPGTILINELRQKDIKKKYSPDDYGELKYKADESMILTLTGGTTGVPKLVESPSNTRLTAYFQMASSFFSPTSEDVIGITYNHPIGPVSQAYYIPPLFGIKVALLEMERFEPEQVIQFIHRERVTWLPLVPTLLVIMLEDPHIDEYLTKFDTKSLRLIVTGGAELPVHIARKAEEKLGVKVVNSFGISDAMAVTASPIDSASEIRWKTVGKIPDGGEIKLVNEEGIEVPKGEVGEIWFRGIFVTGAYFNNPEATREVWTEDGWFKSGDLGVFDENGNLTVVGRKKDMIIRGGQNIYPREIEDLLLTHPNVADVAVVGIPDPIMGEKACAFVAIRKGMLFTFDDMVNFLQEKKIAMFKIPEKLELISDIPRIPETKKIDKKSLRHLIVEKLKAEQKA